MPLFRVDLHIHTVLSPCGSLDMSPVNIVNAALNAKLDLIAITDHNSTRQAAIVRDLARESGLTVICGAEVTTREEVHVLTLFEDDNSLQVFQDFLDEYRTPVINKPDWFGYQVIVDRNDMIIEEEPYLLISALKADIHTVEQMTHRLGGLFIPAHVDRSMNGIISHLGFVPEDLKCDAFGLSARADKARWSEHTGFPGGAVFLQNSDAHTPGQIGCTWNEIEMDQPTFLELKNALKRNGTSND